MEEWYLIERILGADLTSRFEESWSLEEFLKMHGPKLQIKSYPITNDNSISFIRCRFGDTNHSWIYAYVSLRMTDVTPERIVKDKYLLRVGKTELGDYVLYYNGRDSKWESVDITFQESSAKNASYWEEYDRAQYDKLMQDEKQREEALQEMHEQDSLIETKKAKREYLLRQKKSPLIDLSGDDLSLDSEMW